jgi:hypothetical protein
MKKGLIAVSLVLVLAMTFAVPAFAGGKGAVNVALWNMRANPDVIVGSVILNTTANGFLIVLINADEGANLEDWDVRITIEGVMTHFDDVLNTNAQGNGNVMLEVPLAESYPGDTVTVNVWMSQDLPAAPSPAPLYETPWNQTEVPLK